tara:strand:- start:224 stop:613 length:390 start_codon:yes stop_codon:yes gene_type:complete
MAALSSLVAGAPAVHIGHFITNTSTGTQAITGVGFKPSWIIVTGAQTNADAAALSSVNGYYDGTTYYTHGKTINTAATIYQSTGSKLYIVYDVSANENRGVISSFDADGFTINKETANNALTIFYIVGR